MASGAGSQPTRISPRKFSEKIALLNKKEREANAKFEEIIKEVNATKGKPSQPTPTQDVGGSGGGLVLYHDNDLSSLTEAELQYQLSNSTNYKAAHADSLEEIEKVYENLIKSVGQFEDTENQVAGANQEQQQQQQQQQQLQRSTVLHYNDGESIKPAYRSSSAGLVKRLEPDEPNSVAAPAVGNPFYQHPQSNADYQEAKIDLNRHVVPTHCLSQTEPRYSPYELPSSVSLVNHFSRHNTLEVCVSTSCIPQQQQQQHANQATGISDSSGGRGRVVSFGSASRNNYPCVSDVYTQDYLVGAGQQQHIQMQQQQHQQQQQQQQQQQHQQQQQQNYVHQKTAAYHNVKSQHQHIHHQHPNQYLKEPSGDRSRQKSCSDPQLHKSPGQQQQHQHQHEQQMTVGTMIAPCKSDNRLAETATSHTTNTLFRPSTNQRSHQTTPTATNIYGNQVDKIDYTNGQMAGGYGVQHNEDPSCQSAATTTTLQNGHHHFGICDTTTTTTSNTQTANCSLLPGIKICAIDDELARQARPAGQPGARLLPPVEQAANNSTCDTNTSNPSSRDGSLPDISNLKFNSNSLEASPERGPVYQSQQQGWTTGRAVSDESCGQIAMDGNPWPTAYAMDSVEMEIQIDSSQDASDYCSGGQVPKFAVVQQSSADSGQEPLHHQQAAMAPQPGFAQPAARVTNALSNSDCGFGASAFHHQQGKLMICAPSDLYNNIMRSRSHNNISSMNGHKQRPDNFPADNLHHTSQYCLQTNHLQHQQQLSMNVRRIAELKTHGTSTSPLDSSSNLNSPQSEMNSPGSSTTDQCEPSLLFVNHHHHQNHHQHQQQPQQQHEYSIAETLAGGSSSTLVPDGMHFHAQHQSGGSAEALHLAQQYVGQPIPEAFSAADDCSPQQQQLQQPGVYDQRVGVYKRKFNSPSSTTNISNQDLAMTTNNEEEEVEQQQSRLS